MCKKQYYRIAEMTMLGILLAISLTCSPAAERAVTKNSEKLAATVETEQENRSPEPISTVEIQQEKNLSEPRYHTCAQFKFKFFIIDDLLYTETYRQMRVFMDEKGFSEPNLRTLFDYISKLNPDPVGLTVTVYTNWEQFQNPLPHGCGMAMSEGNRPVDYRFQEATYYRRDRPKNREYFRYRLARNSSKTKTVILSGDK